MSVTRQEYDASVVGMRENTVPALAWEMDHAGVLVPVVELPSRARWIRDLGPDDLAAMAADWRLLFVRQADPDRPALVRLDLLFPDRRRLAVLWAVEDPEDLEVLGMAELSDAIAFRIVGAPDVGVKVSNLGLSELDDFRQLSVLMRNPKVVDALSDYLQQHRKSQS